MNSTMTITQEILETIIELGELLPGFLESPYEHSRRIKRSTYYGALSRLEQQGLIAKRHKGDKSVYVPTQKAFNKVKVTLKKRSDGLLTILTFDIPEDRHSARNYFRRHLKSCEFRSVQKSVFVSPNELNQEIRELIVDLKLENYITVIEGKIKKEI